MKTANGKKVKYVIHLLENLMIKNSFLYGVDEKPEAIALTKNFAIRYGERNVQALSIDSEDDSIVYDLTGSFLSK